MKSKKNRVGLYIPTHHLGNFSYKEEFLTGKLPLSGTDGQILRLSKLLSSNGFEVLIFCNANVTDVISGIDVNYYNENNFFEAFESNLNKIDVLILNNRANSDTEKIIIKCNELKVKCIVWDHNGPDKKSRNTYLKNEFVKRVICVSASQVDSVRHIDIFNKINYIHNSINLKEVPQVSKEVNSVCYLGSLTYSKGFHILAESWPYVKKHIPNAKLYVIGSAKLYDRSQKLGSLGIADELYENKYIIPFLGNTKKQIFENGVEFLGLLSLNELRKRIASTQIGVVNPNTKVSIETFCISAVEIQALGVPVIGGHSGGLLETVQNNKSGILVRNKNQLGKEIVRLLLHIDLNEYSKNAIEHVKKFDEEIIVKKWALLISSVINDEPNKIVKFSIKRYNLRVFVKEIIRQLKLIKTNLYD